MIFTDEGGQDQLHEKMCALERIVDINLNSIKKYLYILIPTRVPLTTADQNS